MPEFLCEQSIGSVEAARYKSEKPPIIKYQRVWIWVCRSDFLILEAVAFCWGKCIGAAPEIVCMLQSLQQLLSKDMGDAIHPLLPVSWNGRAEEGEVQKANDWPKVHSEEAEKTASWTSASENKPTHKPQGTSGLKGEENDIPQTSKMRAQKSHCRERKISANTWSWGALFQQ